MKKKLNILVTGANGQLGLTLRGLSKTHPEIDFNFCSSAELDITNKTLLSSFFEQKAYDYCINCAAYTNVEKAELETEMAFKVNAEAVKTLSLLCKEKNTTLIHISTDYVFDGDNKKPYTENDATNPINVYGASKLKGEEYIINNTKQYYIIRTSWLYASYGQNFYTFIKKKLDENSQINVLNTHFGSPTNTDDLGNALIYIISNDKKNYGIYHFSNKGVTNWYIFAKSIIEYLNYNDINHLFPIEGLKRKAKRPIYSALNTSKFENEFNYRVPNWRESLKRTADFE